MSDEKKTETAVEMTPGDDGTKVPLTAAGTPGTEEAKFVVNPNGDAKVDVGSAPTFSGLNKEELMKYSDDPFWVRLRWILFILFWVAWAAMLVMAVIIIIQAPRCKPPPVRLWVEEGALYQVDTQSLPTDKELIAQMNTLGVKSCYLPGLISENDFAMSNYDADALIKGLVADHKGVVTDLPSKISPNNDLFVNASKAGVIDSSGNFIYSNGNLSSLVQVALTGLMSRGVKGFLMNEATTTDQKMFKDSLNGLISEDGGGVGSDIVNMKNVEGIVRTPPELEDYLMQRKDEWAFYKFSPNYDPSSFRSNYQVRLMNIALYMFRGTPILQSFDQSTMSDLAARALTELSAFRSHDGVKFGVVNFVNNTDSNLFGYTRVQKGTPAYAIALNFGQEATYMNFTGTPNIAEQGNVQFDSETGTLNDVSDIRRKVPLSEVPLKPREGLIIQFVANFG